MKISQSMFILILYFIHTRIDLNLYRKQETKAWPKPRFILWMNFVIRQTGVWRSQRKLCRGCVVAVFEVCDQRGHSEEERRIDGVACDRATEERHGGHVAIHQAAQSV